MVNNMKNLILLFIFILVTSNGMTQEISGDWHGVLSIQSMKLRISFHIKKDGDTFTSTMDSPDQGAMGIATTATEYKNNTLTITMKNMGAEFKGRLNASGLEGTFSQGAMKIPLLLTQKETAKVQPKPRPQDPIKPYPYQSQEIFFVNKKANNIKLAGTLSLPKNVKNPAVAILISGSGPQNRDEEVKIFNHRPFLVWSDYLTRNGIAVLRFDDRGVAQSQGSQKNATSADFATDVEAAVDYLLTRNDVIDTTKIGLIGHSEGGLIAPMVAAHNKNIAFIVLLAGPGVDGGKLLLSQTKRAAQLAGEKPEFIAFNQKISKTAFAMVKKEKDLTKLGKLLTSYLQKVRHEHPQYADDFSDDKINSQVKSLTSVWLSYFIRTNPQDFLKKVDCPVLAINGSLDFQVIAEQNLAGIKKSLATAHNKSVTIKKLNGLNHLLQEAQTGALDEYAKIEQTVSPIALKEVSNWIKQRF